MIPLFLLAIYVLLCDASPVGPSAAPGGTSDLDLHEIGTMVNGKIWADSLGDIRYDRKQRRQVSGTPNCGYMSPDSPFFGSPGWQKLKEYVKSDIGGWDEYFINSNDRTYDWWKGDESSAFVCANVDGQSWTPLNPECNVNDLDLNLPQTRVPDGSTATYAGQTMIQVGMTASTSTTIQHEFGVTVGVSGSAKFLGAGVDFSVEVGYTSQRRMKAHLKIVGQALSVTGTLESAPVGMSCKMKLSQKLCKSTSSGTIPMVARGIIWFKCNNQCSSVNDPDRGGHYFWGYDIHFYIGQESATYLQSLGMRLSVSGTGSAEIVCDDGTTATVTGSAGSLRDAASSFVANYDAINGGGGSSGGGDAGGGSSGGGDTSGGIADWETCTINSSICSNPEAICCVATADVSEGKATCRPLGGECSSIPDWQTCTADGAPCTSSDAICCVAVGDLSSGKTT
ncbi:hypothetical protein BJ742DRAFT_880628 [Cladochytrium replicatum]|nr:hypothetical protein BJ742DRAFT_880628 [Cladochytrium replicatum]